MRTLYESTERPEGKDTGDDDLGKICKHEAKELIKNAGKKLTIPITRRIRDCARSSVDDAWRSPPAFSSHRSGSEEVK